MPAPTTVTQLMIDSFKAAHEIFHGVLFDLYNYNQLLKVVMQPHRPLTELAPLPFPTYDATQYLALYSQVSSDMFQTCSRRIADTLP